MCFDKTIFRLTAPYDQIMRALMDINHQRRRCCLLKLPVSGRHAIRFGAAACRFRDALSESARAGKRRPGKDADETFFAPILTEHALNEFFIDLIRSLREYER